MGLSRKPLFWAAVLGALAAHAARGAGALSLPRDPAWSGAARSGPVSVGGRIDGPARGTRRGWRSRLAFASATGTQRALVWLPAGIPPAVVEPGRAAVVDGSLRSPRRARDPGDFDEEAALTAAGCAWVLQARTVRVSTAPPAAADLPLAWAQRARLSAEGVYARRLPPDRAALLAGIALGDAGAMPAALAHAVRDAGATHLLVASGSNVGFAAAAALALGLAAGLRPGARGALALLLAGFYTLMAGADPPCVRAWLMLAAALAARASGRLTTGPAALVLAAAVMLAVDPASALSPSALMSVGACAAIMWAGAESERLVPSSWHALARGAAVLFLGSVAVAVALLPLWIAVFGRVSLVGPLVNLVLVPLSGPLLGGGFLLWGADALCPPAAPLVARLVGLGLALFERVCERASALPWAAVELRPWTPAELAAWGMALAALLARGRPRTRAALVAGAVLTLAAGRIASRPPPVSALFLAGGGVLVRFDGGPARHFGPRPAKASARRAARAVGAAPLSPDAVGGPWRLRLGTVEFLVGDPRGPGFRRGKGPFAIIGASRALPLELTTDGENLTLRTFLPGVRLDPRVSKRGQAGLFPHAQAREVSVRRARGQGPRRGTPPVGARAARRRPRHRARRRRHDAARRA